MAADPLAFFEIGIPSGSRALRIPLRPSNTTLAVGRTRRPSRMRRRAAMTCEPRDPMLLYGTRAIRPDSSSPPARARVK